MASLRPPPSLHKPINARQWWLGGKFNLTWYYPNGNGRFANRQAAVPRPKLSYRRYLCAFNNKVKPSRKRAALGTSGQPSKES
jgi:hypothetical protein